MNAATKIAQAITRTHNMRVRDMVVEIYFSTPSPRLPFEVSPNTFIYINSQGELDRMEKSERNSSPEDSAHDIGYVFDHEYKADVLQAIRESR